MTRTGPGSKPPAPAARADEEARVGAVYRRYADRASRRRAWSAANPGNAAMRAELLELVLALGAAEIAGEGRVLDIGCGNGFWLERLAEHGVADERLSGVEIQPERAATASRAVPGARVLAADARDLPLPSGAFELVLLFTVLSSLASRADARTALVEARRVLAPGGLLLCYEPRLPNPLNRQTVRPRRSDYASVLGPGVRSVPCTVLPQLARRLGRLTPVLYPALRRLRPILTHRLAAFRPDPDVEARRPSSEAGTSPRSAE